MTIMSQVLRETLWLTRWQLRQAQHLIQLGQVWCNSVEAELRDMERR